MGWLQRFAPARPYKEEWLCNVRGDMLSGLVVGIVLVPEAIAFSVVAGVDPAVGLYASVCIAILTAIFGGRPGMVSAATGAMALVMVDLVANHGIQYMLAASIMCGLIQLVAGLLGAAKLTRYIPNSVMIAFVNALGISIFMSQAPQLWGGSLASYLICAATLAIVYILPKFVKAIPAPLIAIVLFTAISMVMGLDVPIVGDEGALPTSLPDFLFPDIPLTLETLQIIAPTAISLAIVGIMEALLTSQIVDEATHTKSNRTLELCTQGVANMITGCIGGMAGAAMIGQSGVNLSNGGRGRLSVLVGGVSLGVLVLVFGDLAQQIPMAVLIGIMIKVSIGTVDWGSFKYCKTAPKTDVAVMIVTMAIVLATNNLAYGVVAGIILAALFFVHKVSRINITEKQNIYTVAGPLFFASATRFVAAFESVTEKSITIDLTSSNIWDESGVGALVKTMDALESDGISVTLVGMNPTSTELYNKTLGITA